MSLLNFSLFINKSTTAPVPDDVSTSDRPSDTDRMQEYIRANYNNDSLPENTENVDINSLLVSVSEVSQTIKEKPSFGLDDMASVKSVKQKAEENNRVAAQQVKNAEATANAKNQVAEGKVQDEENRTVENNNTAQEEVNNAETSVESIQQKVTAAEQTLSNAKNSLSEAQNALNNATTDEEKEAAKSSLEKVENEVSEAEKALDAAKQELNKAQEGLNNAKTSADTIQKEGEQAVQAAKSNANKVKEEGSANINNAEANKEKVEDEGEIDIKEFMLERENVSAEELFKRLDTNKDNIINADDYMGMELINQFKLEELGIERVSDTSYNTEQLVELIKQKELQNITTEDIINNAAIKYNEVKQNDKTYKNYLYSKEHVEENAAQPRIKNDYYEGEFSYTREFNDNSIIITNTDTQEKTTLDLTNLLAPFDDSDKSKLIAAFKQMPAESLLDLNTEVIFTNQKVGKGTDGNYNSFIDKVTVSGGSMCVETIIHELGHAMDNRGTYVKETDSDGTTYEGYIDTYYESQNQKFSTVFQEELAEYKKLFKQPTQIHSLNEQTKAYEVETHNNITLTGTDYAVLNEKEMFAECYTLCMLGHCQSMDTITKYFPKSLEASKEIIKSTRQLTTAERKRKF